MTTRSPFDWKTGEPSIFLKDKEQRNQFNGVDHARSTMQTRIEPRPLFLVSDSLYLKPPKTVRKKGKKK